MNRAVIAGYSRSPFTIAKKGDLVGIRPEDILADVIKNLLIKSERVLKIGGRIVIISFHSIEDRIVKRFFQGKDRKDEVSLKLVSKKPIKPSLDEVKRNPRSRSAILRVAEKIC